MSCPYCETEDPTGWICETEPEKDLFVQEFDFMGEHLSWGCGIEQGKLHFYNFDYNGFLEVEINYCPMCGRKLGHWDDIE